jgi:hypothetical protein
MGSGASSGDLYGKLSRVPPTALRELLKVELGEDPVTYARRRRRELEPSGKAPGWEKIAREITVETGRWCSGENLRRWDEQDRKEGR